MISNSCTRILFVYHDCTQVVETYPKQTTKIPLPKSVDIDSLLITDDKGNIIPFRYKSQHINPRVQDTITVTKNGVNYSGKLISMTDSGVTIYSDNNTIVIRNYDTMTIHNIKTQWSPYIKIEPQDNVITVNYLFSEITWKVVGTGIITDSNINLCISSQITNNTDHNIIAQIYCIAGSISKHRPMPHMMRTLAVEQSLISKIEDYTMYNVGQRKLEQMTVVEMGSNNYPVVKFYEHHTNQPDIRVGYRFKTSQYIPNMTIYMYTNDHNYIGTAEISEYQAREEVDLLLNQSSMVRCETTIQVEEPDKNTKVEYLELKIINNNTNDIFLVVKHDLGNKKLIQSTCPVAKHRGNYLEWYFLIHPNTEESAEYFRCTLNITN